MSRLAPALLDPARYAKAYELATRYADVDPNRHINNVAMSAMFEDARVRYDMDFDYHSHLAGRRVMVAAVHVDFLAEAHYPEPLRIAMAVVDIGRTSWTVGQLASQGRKPSAFCRAVVVCCADSGPVPLPETFRARLEADWLQRA